MQDVYQLMLAACVGLGLSAACGFRVFVPMLVMGVAQRAGMMQMSTSWDWVGSDWAILTLGVATALEVGAYYVPWLDNALDTVATPASVIAGAVAGAWAMGHIQSMDPSVQWALGIIGGGGTAASIQAVTVGTRALSSITTGGIANPVVSTAENAISTALALTAVILPPLALLVVVLVVCWLVKLVVRRGRRRAVRPTAIAAA